MQKKIKHPSSPSIKHNNFIRHYIVQSEINQSIAVEGLNCVMYATPYAHMSSAFNVNRRFILQRNDVSKALCKRVAIPLDMSSLF